MSKLKLGGGLLTAVGVIAGIIVQAADIKIDHAYGQWALIFCGLAAALGVGLIAWSTIQPRTIRTRQTEEKSSSIGDSYNNFGENFGHMGPMNKGMDERRKGA